MNVRERSRDILARFPTVQHAFAYGSKVFAQEKDPGRDALLDFVFVVDEPKKWHDENLVRHPRHYSCVGRWGGGPAADFVAERIGAGVYFNTHAEVGNERIKYGVTATDTIVEDLKHWRTFYMAGRMQKPVLHLVKSPRMARAVEQNITAATATALLLLPETFSKDTFYRTIVSLSYMGDIRMKFAEDSNKVHNIATGSATELQEMYDAAVQHYASQKMVYNIEKDQWSQEVHPDARVALLKRLPPGLLSQLKLIVGRETALDALSKEDALRTAQAVVKKGDATELVMKGLARMNCRSSRRQAMAGLLSAGWGGAVAYVARKLRKSYRSRRS
eukprot:scaffold659_cov318-Pavlova_lutheri.AAC.6